MVGEPTIQGAQPVEYIEETTFATQEDSDYQWIGITTSFSSQDEVETESATYLPDFGASNKLDKNINIKQSEIWEADVTYHPQDFKLLQYFTGSDGGTSDDVSSVQFGVVNESADPTTFRSLLGGVGEEFTFSVDENSTAEVDASFTFADGTEFTSTDYVDTGTHATEDSTEPFAYKDLGNITYGGTDIQGAVEGLEFSVANELVVVRDPSLSGTRDSLVYAIVVVDREITVDLTLTYESFDLATEIRSYQPKDLVFDVGATTFTITGVQFPEFPYEMTPDDLIGDTVSSDRASGITWV
jgi:hypothetical protein